MKANSRRVYSRDLAKIILKVNSILSKYTEGDGPAETASLGRGKRIHRLLLCRDGNGSLSPPWRGTERGQPPKN